MRQLLPTWAARAVCLSLLPIMGACIRKPVCHDLQGGWTNREGQEFYFEDSGKALWLTRFGSSFDTVVFDYRLDCSQRPAAIDLVNFQGGPYVGRSLYGILEWTSDTSLRLNFEPDAGDRPTAFNPEQTLRFVRKEEG